MQQQLSNFMTNQSNTTEGILNLIKKREKLNNSALGTSSSSGKP
mgnify:CR=1 FL=1